MREFSRILVPLDGSELAENALRPAITLARQFDSTIFLLRAIDFLHPTVLAPQLTVTTAEAMTAAYEESCRQAHDYLQKWQHELGQQGLEVKTLLRDAGPAEGILEAAIAHQIDIIVISTHGRGGLARWALGSVADKVSRHASCPVLLVRQDNKHRVEHKEVSDV